jgi:sigma-B regulation protein RsbQ
MSFDLNQEILLKCNVNLSGQGERMLVMCQSLTSNQTIWRHQIDTLGKHYTCLTFDFLGSGKSDIKANEAQRYISIQPHLTDFLTILDRLDINKIDFVGHGVGGNIGMLAAAQRPDFFRSLHLLDVTPKYLTSDDFEGCLSNQEFEILWQILGRDYLGWSEISHIEDQHVLTETPALKALYIDLKALRPDFAQGALRIKYDLDMRQTIHEIKAPLHFYHSLKEPLVPFRISEYYGEHAPSAIIRILNSEGGRPQLTTPDELNQLLTNYLA